ncbi:HD-GYP domain-containing protein [Bacillus salacetis]|uniref:HD-GYP domain-containing protein n=1 Tax=Bacillus salacetis TaxID=2315464 RepID=A0A3A1QVM2_9BACI|nr:HD-GYP domain-containing protein [Bacillus salacetis]RIW31565.1 HD-GYP domain-containing protein [Bacillus salacetis]
MRIKALEAEEGCILEKDIMGMTSMPIIPKNTVLQEIHMKVLHAFQIGEVSVKRTKVDGTPFYPNQVVEMEEDRIEQPEQQRDDFLKLYLTKVQQFKAEFTNWQAGMPVSISRIRNIILPLLALLEEDTVNITSLHRYTSKADYMYHHPLAVGLLSGLIAKKIGFDRGQKIQVALAGILADCGMAKIPASILTKQTALSETEFKEIKMHPVYSYKMVKDISLLKTETKLAIFQHHERLDDSGYPTGEKKERIHQFSQIIAVADVYHAMTSERVYRGRQLPFQVLEQIKEDHFGKYDIKVVQALMEVTAGLSIGDVIRLSDGQKAEVMFTTKESPTRPLIQIKETGVILDLTKRRDLYIEEVSS